VDEFDYIHTLIYVDEMARSGSLGPGGAITTGMAFGVPPILKFGSKALQERFLPDLLTGKKRICIAITEPSAGSDVGNIQTTATRTKDGKHFIVNGTKKWITNGLWSDYASMAVRTGGPGPAGLSMLVVPLLHTKGVNMRRIKVQGQTAAGTTFIELDDVLVPVENLIGKEGMGMKYVMQNFNHERLSISIGVNRLSRVAIGAAFEYCLKREAFGKPLMDQPVVRHRLAKCGAELESHWAWTEQFTYSLTKMSEEEANRELGGLTALLKAQAGRVIESCASTAVLLFGGNGYSKSGQGEVAERMLPPLPFDCFVAWSLKIGNRDLPRSPRRQNPRWKRRRDVGRGYQTTSQEFPAEDEGTGNSCGRTFRIFKTLDLFYYTATYNTYPIHSTSESTMVEKEHALPSSQPSSHSPCFHNLSSIARDSPISSPCVPHKDP
jgi:acyl-CoA dehydrogenase